ncbi:enoyl-CoA hydratase/isomerase family protein [Streptomyces sp. SID8374]|uniref:enoyl-CoA hydratase/isomerase family protein n=1 Tax=Streptomyces sp. SID8374 TaxID=2690354 RepID=UPI0013683A2B|nr:enoyl-CoA hydratase/isomerase family protein [Streptomyces sp. SID8374]MYX17605.1 enoyl-CoA hydratase/isomerase family protein [Streptomyces sp. SID8374]
MTLQEPAAGPTESPLSLERHGRVVTLTLNRPHRRNAMSTLMLSQLSEALRKLTARGEETPGALVLTGAGGTFSSGADTREPDWRDLSRRAVRRAHFRTVFAALHEAPFPVVAAVEGYALGGGLELALACDLVVAGEGALFGLPELGVGAVPGGGAVHSLVRRAGRGVAARMLLIPGEHVRADELARLGAVERVVPDGGALAEARALAAAVAEGDPALLEAGVRLLRDSGHLDRTAALGVENGYWWQAASAASLVDQIQ